MRLLSDAFFIFDRYDNEYHKTFLVRPIDVNGIFSAQQKYAKMVLGAFGDYINWFFTSAAHDYSCKGC